MEIRWWMAGRTFRVSDGEAMEVVGGEGVGEGGEALHKISGDKE